MRRIAISLSALLFFGPVAPSFADEAADKAAGYKCSEAKELVKIMKKMSDLKPEQTDSVHGNPSMKMTLKDGGEMPERIFYRHDGQETGFNLSEDGAVTDIKKIGSLDKDGEMCIEDKKRPVKPDEEDGIDISMNFHVEYKNQSGSHGVPELRDGLEDGRTHVKKLVPAPFRMMIPKFTHVKIAYVADETDPVHENPQIVALQGDVKVDGLLIEKMFDSYYVGIDQLQEIGADRLGVYGGPYRMEPSASPDKMRKMVEKRRKVEQEQ